MISIFQTMLNLIKIWVYFDVGELCWIKDIKLEENWLLADEQNDLTFLKRFHQGRLFYAYPVIQDQCSVSLCHLLPESLDKTAHWQYYRLQTIPERKLMIISRKSFVPIIYTTLYELKL